MIRIDMGFKEFLGLNESKNIHPHLLKGDTKKVFNIIKPHLGLGSKFASSRLKKQGDLWSYKTKRGTTFEIYQNDNKFKLVIDGDIHYDWFEYTIPAFGRFD